MFKRIKNSFDGDIALLSCSSIGWLGKLNFIFQKYLAIILNNRKIKYFENNFRYDSRLAPLILQFYPKEIVLLSKNIDINSINTVLDIGANVGQWAYTLKSLYHHLKIFSFEPNKIAYDLLKKNASSFKDWNVYNFAVGEKTQKKAFYYSKNSTLSGSFIKSAAYEFNKDITLKKTLVSVVNLNEKSLKKLKIPASYDLVKIDVEGSELEVLESLKSLDFNYLVIEVPLKSKRKVNLHQIEKILKNKLKKKPKLIDTYAIGNLGLVADAVYKL